MKTVNSLSGGRTSSYLAVHYPADYEIFALCCIDSHNAGKDIDRVMKQRVNDKLQKYCKEQPVFVATSEDPKILKVMFDLEQKIGREIIWVRGTGWEKMIKLKKAIPNRAKRFCTTILKMEPIFNFLYKYAELPIEMRIGYRYDEMERMDNFKDTWKFPAYSTYFPKSNRWRYHWETIIWRIGSFKLIEDKVTHWHIKKYWDGENIDFPIDSNCLDCFWKHPQQLRKNFDTCNAVMQWSKIMEDLAGNTFKDNISFHSIEKLNIQQEFIFGTGAGCTAGFCTD